MKKDNQRALDADRQYYELTFPRDLSEKQIHDFLRSIGKNLNRGSTIRGVPTVVFETWAQADGGIHHRLRVPKPDSTYIIGQLYTHLPGIDVSLLPAVSDVEFMFGATVRMQNSSEELSIASAEAYAAGLLGSMQDAVHPQDVVVLQWIIAHARNQKVPAADRPLRSNRGSVVRWIMGNTEADRDEVASRRSKQHDQNFLTIGRIGAMAATPDRAENMVLNIVRRLASEGGSANLYARRANPRETTLDIAEAKTPLLFTGQKSVKELAAVIGWPIGDAYIPGLTRGSTQHMPAAESVPRTGRVLGKSTMPGMERQVAMDYESATMHVLIAGGNGVGKTTLMNNMIRQDMARGCGIFLMERDGNLFQRALDQIPPDRMKDLICIDLSRDDLAVGLNLLRHGKPAVVATQLAQLLDALYPDIRSMYSNQVVTQGIPVLANLERATIADLIPLVHPRTPVEKAWAKDAISRMPDKTYTKYWEDWYAQDAKEIARLSQPVKNRLMEILTPEATRHLVNQEVSSFGPEEVVAGNKLLFINLAGADERAASLIGTMIVTLLWDATKRTMPTNPNFMYLDEFQQFGHLSSDFEDMLATARKRRLGLVIATQYVDRLKPTTQDAVMANARTKVIFQSSIKASRLHASDFASRHVTPDSFMNLKAYDTLARINTATGISEPVTMHTFGEPRGYGLGQSALRHSIERYGRAIEQIQRDDATRRRVTTPTTNAKPRARRSAEWSPEEDSKN